ncbi:AGAP005787-PA-like protein [Anopheles sinensis]|uniref:AGAP005787-PA-like protein n=1 Tax=Anopheles sinensis TaxID=74873 RepID=A0A084WEB9_ANOSI|nr:AGAP005787-PA-like protein [Anopheles sinensis]
MNKIISLFALVAIVALASGKPQPKPNVLAYNVAGVPVLAAAPTVASYATFYEQTFLGNLAPASYVTYSAYDPFLATVPVPVAAPVLLNK